MTTEADVDDRAIDDDEGVCRERREGPFGRHWSIEDMKTGRRPYGRHAGTISVVIMML